MRHIVAKLLVDTLVTRLVTNVSTKCSLPMCPQKKLIQYKVSIEDSVPAKLVAKVLIKCLQCACNVGVSNRWTGIMVEYACMD